MDGLEPRRTLARRRGPWAGAAHRGADGTAPVDRVALRLRTERVPPVRTAMRATSRLACLMALVGCGGDPSGPARRGPPGLSIVAGSAVSGTIDALLDQALVAAVHHGDGRPMSNVIVRFTPVTST